MSNLDRTTVEMNVMRKRRNVNRMNIDVQKECVDGRSGNNRNFDGQILPLIPFYWCTCISRPYKHRVHK